MSTFVRNQQLFTIFIENIPLSYKSSLCIMLASISSSLAPGFNVRNESNIPILVVLSQLSPLHWCKVSPGELKHIECGRVFFTVSVEPWIEGKEPTKAEVAARLAVVIAATVLGGGMTGFAITGLISGLTSYRGLKKSGVYANGRTLVVRGQTNQVDMAHVDLTNAEAEPRVHPTGVYQLFIHSLEFTNRNAALDTATHPVVTEANATVATQPVPATHPFYSEEAATDSGKDEVSEVVFNVPGMLAGVAVEDDEHHTHTADYIQV